MSDSESTIAPLTPTPEMEAEPQHHHQEEEEPIKKPSNNTSTNTNGNGNSNINSNSNTNSLAFSIWPPTHRTREAVVSRLIETLSTESILSKRYGTLPHDEASAAARFIEEEAFGAAAASASAEDDGIEILQVYSREISRRMLDTVKNRAASSASSAVDASAPHTPSPSLEPTASEDESPTVTES